jgi:hypothetical protein
VLKSCSKDKIKDAKNFNPTEVYNSMRDKKWQAAALEQEQREVLRMRIQFYTENICIPRYYG